MEFVVVVVVVVAAAVFGVGCGVVVVEVVMLLPLPVVVVVAGWVFMAINERSWCLLWMTSFTRPGVSQRTSRYCETCSPTLG